MKRSLMWSLLALVMVVALVLVSSGLADENEVSVFQDVNHYKIVCKAQEPVAAITVLLRFESSKVTGFEPGPDLKESLWVKLEDNFEFTIATFSLNGVYGPGKIELGTVETASPSKADTFTNSVGLCLAYCTRDCRTIKPRFKFHGQGSDVDDGIQGSVPKEYMLRAHPNPFNPAVNIEFSVPVRQKVDIYVCNILGQKVITLYSNESEGLKTIQWSPQEASGTFFVIMKCPQYERVQKLTLLK